MNKKKSNVKALGVFVLAMINVAAVLSLRNLPPMAEFGWSSIGWYLIGTITFLIPLELGGSGTRHRLAQGRRRVCLGAGSLRRHVGLHCRLLRMVE